MIGKYVILIGMENQKKRNDMIREKLIELSDKGSSFKEFSASLIPGCEPMLGCRIPVLRSYAKELVKELSKEEFKEYLQNGQEEYYEEILLKGLVIGYAKMDIEESLLWLTWFIPKIQNWAVNDVFCSTYKITLKNRERLWQFFEPYADSDKEFEIRVAAVLYMDYFLTEEYIDKVLKKLNEMKADDYYAMMGIAWALASAYAKFPKETKAAMDWKWDRTTYNKAIQKMCESFRISEEDKIELKGRKIKDE